MLGSYPNSADVLRVAGGKLQDDWTYSIERIPRTDMFRVWVLHPYGDAQSGGTPWPIEDPDSDADPAYPTYASIEDATAAAKRYVDLLSNLAGYPDPDKMSARGLRPHIW
jgi:hypothetical protein